MGIKNVTLNSTNCECGKNSSGSTDTPIGTVVDLTHLKSILFGITAGSQYNFSALTGLDSQGRSWSGSLSLVSDGVTNFEEQEVTARRLLMTFMMENGDPISSVSTSYFFVSSGYLYKTVDSFGTTYYPTSCDTIPTLAQVGDSGVLSTCNGSNGTTVVSTWEINPGHNGAYQFNSTAIVETGGLVISTDTAVCYMNASGIPTKIKLIVTLNGLAVDLSGNID